MSGKSFLAVMCFGLAMMLAWLTGPAASGELRPAEIPYPAFLADVEAKAIRSVTIDGNLIRGHYADGKPFSTTLPAAETPVERLLASGVTVMVRQAPGDAGPVSSGLLQWVPLALFLSPLCLILPYLLWQLIRHRWPRYK